MTKRLAYLACLGLGLLSISCGGDFSLDPNAKSINWRISNCKDTGMSNCGNAMPPEPQGTEETCGTAKATNITIVVTSHANGGNATTTTTTSCPSGSKNGVAKVKLP